MSLTCFGNDELFCGSSLDSKELAGLSDDEKRVAINFWSTDGNVYPEESKIIWLYACSPK